MNLRNVVITLIIFSLIICSIIIFLNLGNFLIVNESPVKSDVIIVLAGDNGLRTAYGVMLLKEGFSNKLLVTGKTPIGDKTTAAVNMEDQAIQLGVPKDDIIVEDRAVSTYENALFSKELLIKDGYKSAVVVTSDYHMRRSRLVFNKAFNGTGIRLTFCSAKDENFTAKSWWSNLYSTGIVVSEYYKLLGYFLLGRF